MTLSNIDRRIIFAAIALGVIIPMIVKSTIPVLTSPVVQAILIK